MSSLCPLQSLLRKWTAGFGCLFYLECFNNPQILGPFGCPRPLEIELLQPGIFPFPTVLHFTKFIQKTQQSSHWGQRDQSSQLTRNSNNIRSLRYPLMIDLVFLYYQHLPKFLIVLISISKEAHKLKFLLGHQRKLKTSQVKLPKTKQTIKCQRAMFISFQIEAEKHQ